MEKHVDSVAQSHKPSAMSNASARLATSPWYFIRPNGTDKDASWARIHHSTVFRNGRLMRHPRRRGASRPGRPIRVSQTRLDFKVSRLACTPGIRETGSGGERGAAYTTMSATGRACALRSDDSDARNSLGARETDRQHPQPAHVSQWRRSHKDQGVPRLSAHRPTLRDRFRPALNPFLKSFE